MNSEREKLIEELRNEHIKHQRLQFIGQEPNDGYSGLADWVISDRQRILAPLVKVVNLKRHTPMHHAVILAKAVAETLRLAGLTGKE